MSPEIPRTISWAEWYRRELSNRHDDRDRDDRRVILVLVVGARAAWFARALVPFAAGGFLYIAAADLVPALRESTRRVVRHVLLVLAGIALTALPLALEAS